MEAELYTPIAGEQAGLAALAPGTPVSALVGILYERDDIQTLNSYARLIWVCTHSPKRSALSNAPEGGENATFRSFCIADRQNMMTVIADHSCQRLTTDQTAALQTFHARAEGMATLRQTSSISRPAWPFSAQQKRQSGNLVFPGCRFVVVDGQARVSKT
ncbi:hypothetical protein [Pseudomonas sp. NPDC089401]|uniref:hypothetical protein n=1 Tax=Pseudomonas sp. NPDC089401 TaxID=3364462 RepID=UPI0038135F6C